MPSTRNCLYAPAHVVANRPALGNLIHPDAAPSFIFGGSSVLDHRLIYNTANSSTGAGVVGWYGNGVLVLNAVPAVLSAVNVSAAAIPVAGTAITLRAATGAGVTVLTSTFLALPSLQTIPVAACALDGNPAYLRIGRGFYTTFYDDTSFLARNLRFTSVGDDHLATVTVRGYDVYGYAMTETVTLSNATVAVGKKAWKWITSITPAGTLSGSNLSVGTGDVYGFGLRCDRWLCARIVYDGTAITANTGFLAADTATATATTGDVRGTYAAQSASDGAKRLEIQILPNATAITAAAGVSVGLFGVAQFSS